ncbi:hypothetical protein Tco_1314038 [Tanacetum coccineum]
MASTLNQGHYRSDCLELKNQNHENQAGGTGARGMVHVLGGGETNQDLNDMEDDINEGLCQAESSHHVTFVNKSIFTYILEKQNSVRYHLIPNPKPRIRDTSLVALGQFAIKLARQKSYANVRRKNLEFQVGDRVMLKVLEKVGDVAYKLELPQESSRVHNTLHVSNLKKCYFDEPLAVSLDEIHIDDKLYFVE